MLLARFPGALGQNTRWPQKPKSPEARKGEPSTSCCRPETQSRRFLWRQAAGHRCGGSPTPGSAFSLSDERVSIAGAGGVRDQARSGSAILCRAVRTGATTRGGEQRRAARGTPFPCCQQLSQPFRIAAPRLGLPRQTRSLQARQRRGARIVERCGSCQKSLIFHLPRTIHRAMPWNRRPPRCRSPSCPRSSSAWRRSSSAGLPD